MSHSEITDVDDWWVIARWWAIARRMSHNMCFSLLDRFFFLGLIYSVNSIKSYSFIRCRIVVSNTKLNLVYLCYLEKRYKTFYLRKRQPEPKRSPESEIARIRDRSNQRSLESEIARPKKREDHPIRTHEKIQRTLLASYLQWQKKE
jgi:hypothetical protein